MDSLGIELWEAKRTQHRANRKALYKKCLDTFNTKELDRDSEKIKRIYCEATEYNGTLILNWRQYFNEYWKRSSPITPSIEASVAREEISEIIEEERRMIDAEITALLPKPANPNDIKLSESGQSHLNNSCAVLLKRSHAEIETLKELRESELNKEAIRRRDRRVDIVVQFILILLSAFLGAYAMNLFTREESALLKEQISIYREQVTTAKSQVSEISRLRAANDSINNELSKLREDYRFILRWTIKSPEQIDREISRLKEDLTRKRQEITQEYSKRRGEHHSDMVRRGISDSSINSSGEKKIDADEKEAIKKAELETTRLIEDLAEQKRKLLMLDDK
jgi:hypothetical protein